MKKFLPVILYLTFFIGALIFLTSSIDAQERSICSPFSPTKINRTDNSVTFTTGPTTPGEFYRIEVDVGRTPTCISGQVLSPWIEARSDSITHTFEKSRCDDRIFNPNNYKGNVSLKKRGTNAPMCTSNYTLASSCQLSISPTTLDTNTPLVVRGSNVPRGFTINRLVITGARSNNFDVNISPDNSFTQQVGALESAGSYTVRLLQYQPQQGGKVNDACPTMNIQVGFPGQPVENQESISADASSDRRTPFRPLYCNNETGIETAIGCIPVKDTNAFIAWFLGWAIGIAGGIAFLLIVTAGFMVMTAAGNPERAQAGRELLTAAISGLIIIIFSAFLLKLIGVDILRIPGFG